MVFLCSKEIFYKSDSNQQRLFFFFFNLKREKIQSINYFKQQKEYFEHSCETAVGKDSSRVTVIIGKITQQIDEKENLSKNKTFKK